MKRTSILVIEDDLNIQAMYCDALEAGGFKVSRASTGEEGVTMALSEHPEIILLDIMLPDISGHEALKKIRADQWGTDAKVVFLTNMSDAENVVHAVEAGSEEYIIKVHTTPKELVNKVRTVSHM